MQKGSFLWFAWCLGALKAMGIADIQCNRIAPNIVDNNAGPHACHYLMGKTLAAGFAEVSSHAYL